jgi:hypothetical protein
MEKNKKVEYSTPMKYRLQIIKEQSPEEYKKLMVDYNKTNIVSTKLVFISQKELEAERNSAYKYLI